MAKFMRSDKGSETKDESGTDETAKVQRQEPLRSPRLSMEPSVIGPSLKVTGNLESDAEIQLEGIVEGDIRAKTVTIGEGAKVKGAIHGETVNIAGTTDGEIEARTVVVEQTAHVTGDIIHESLQIAAGAYVNGHCRPEFGKRDKGIAPPRPAALAEQPETKGSAGPVGAPGNVGPAAI